MSIRRKNRWYIATIGGITVCSRDRLEAFNRASAMFSANFKNTVRAVPSRA